MYIVTELKWEAENNKEVFYLFLVVTEGVARHAQQLRSHLARQYYGCYVWPQ